MFDTSWITAQRRFTRRVLWGAGAVVGAFIALALLYSVWPRRVRGLLYPDGTCWASAAGTVVADSGMPYEVSQPSPSVLELRCDNVHLVIGIPSDTGFAVGTYRVRAMGTQAPAPREAHGVARAPSGLAGFLAFGSLVLSDVELRSLWGRLRVDRFQGDRPVGSFTFWARPEPW